MKNREVTLRTGARSVTAGDGHRTLINVLVGANTPDGLEEERRKVLQLWDAASPPDIFTDLSLLQTKEPLLQTIVDETQCIAAALPVYTVSLKEGRIDDAELLETAIRQMEMGAGILTIHPTPRRDIIAAAMSRMTPWTSRGGRLVIADLMAREGVGDDNAYLRILPDLVSAAREHSVVLSLGSTFRPANIFDSNDAAQNMELDLQLKLSEEIGAAGVGVIIESPGHCRPSDIRHIAGKLAQATCPIMPLGPIPTDVAVGHDHIASSIGVTLLGLHGCAHIISVVTRYEHTGGIPDLEALREGLAAAKVAAHIIDIEKMGATEEDFEIAKSRSTAHTCIAGSGMSGCERCGFACPLLVDESVAERFNRC